MKNILFIVSLAAILFYSQIFAGSLYNNSNQDTTIKVVLENGKGAETVNCGFNDSLQSFVISIGNAVAGGKFTDAFDVDFQLVDIDNSDKYKDLVLIGQGPDDDNDCYFYEYADGGLLICGRIEDISSFRTNGDKTLQADSWMGFWVKTDDYSFESKKLILKPKETYSVKDVKGKVREKISLLKDRSDGSSAAGSLKPGTGFTITKADLSPKSTDTEGNDNSFEYYWYYIKANDGTEGWCRLRSFQDKVDDLPWAD